MIALRCDADAALLTIDEAQRLAAALSELAEDLAADAAARTWSQNAVLALTRNP